ncbi:MAG: hypothetical protein NTZ38_03485 [Candidatus Taylorbacteria bacterium]|nr:hypothetical protein [Candidatus Taylorbacteria bacterium]
MNSRNRSGTSQSETVTVYCNSFNNQERTGKFKSGDTGWVPDELSGGRVFSEFNGVEWLPRPDLLDLAF